MYSWSKVWNCSHGGPQSQFWKIFINWNEYYFLFNLYITAWIFLCLNHTVQFILFDLEHLKHQLCGYWSIEVQKVENTENYIFSLENTLYYINVFLDYSKHLTQRGVIRKLVAIWGRGGNTRIFMPQRINTTTSPNLKHIFQFFEFLGNQEI